MKNVALMTSLYHHSHVKEPPKCLKEWFSLPRNGCPFFLLKKSDCNADTNRFFIYLNFCRLVLSVLPCNAETQLETNSRFFLYTVIHQPVVYYSYADVNSFRTASASSQALSPSMVSTYTHHRHHRLVAVALPHLQPQRTLPLCMRVGTPETLCLVRKGFSWSFQLNRHKQPS